MSEASEITEVATDPTEQVAPAIDIAPAQIETLIDQLGDYYNIPPEQKERVKSAQFLFLEPEAFKKEVMTDLEKTGVLKEQSVVESSPELEAVAQALGTTVKEIQQKQIAMHEELAENILKFGGTCQRIDGRLKITIKVGNDASREKVIKTLKHELLHGLSKLDNNHSGLQGELGTCHYLNEAATEILRIHEET